MSHERNLAYSDRYSGEFYLQKFRESAQFEEKSKIYWWRTTLLVTQYRISSIKCKSFFSFYGTDGRIINWLYLIFHEKKCTSCHYLFSVFPQFSDRFCIFGLNQKSVQKCTFLSLGYFLIFESSNCSILVLESAVKKIFLGKLN